jgi:hypothetical protein
MMPSPPSIEVIDAGLLRLGHLVAEFSEAFARGESPS